MHTLMHCTVYIHHIRSLCTMYIFLHICISRFLYIYRFRYDIHTSRRKIEIDVQPIAFGVALVRSQISIDDLVLWVSFTTFR